MVTSADTSIVNDWVPSARCSTTAPPSPVTVEPDSSPSPLIPVTAAGTVIVSPPDRTIVTRPSVRVAPKSIRNAPVSSPTATPASLTGPVIVRGARTVDTPGVTTAADQSDVRTGSPGSRISHRPSLRYRDGPS